MTSSSGSQPSWLREFSLPDDPSGALIALDFGVDGLWAGRVEHGATVRSATEPRIRPEVLDARIAAYLRDTGSVDASTPEAFGELVAVVARGRRALVDHDSSLTMGFERLRLVRLSLDDVVEATVPEANRAHGMVVELAGSDPVDAILLGPGHTAWPGLWEALTERGFSVLLPGDDFPVTFAGDDHPTQALAPVPQPSAVRAWENSGDNPALVDPADYGLGRFGNPLLDDQGASAPTPGPAAVADPPQQQGLRGRVIALGIVIMLGIGGGGIALAMNAHESNGPDLDTADPTTVVSSTTSSGPEPEHVDGMVNPADLEAARAPMSSYSTPPPPPPPPSTTTTTEAPRQTEARPGPEPQAPTRHQRRTIPNPIPGLPPIVIG